MHKRSEIRDFIVTRLNAAPGLVGIVYASRVHAVQADRSVIVYTTTEESDTETIGRVGLQVRQLTVNVELYIKTSAASWDLEIDALAEHVETALAPVDDMGPLTDIMLAAFNVITAPGERTPAAATMEFVATYTQQEGDPDFVPIPPVLDDVPDIEINESLLPSYYPMDDYLASRGNGYSLTWSLLANPPEITIDAISGLLTVAAGTDVAAHPMTLVVTTTSGSDSDPFTVTVDAEILVPPVLDDVPDLEANEAVLPRYYEMSEYLIDAGAGDNLTYSLTGNPAGITIVGASGLMTVAEGTAVGAYPMSLVVTTTHGSDSDPFTYTVEALALTPPELRPPDPVVVEEDDLPHEEDMAKYLVESGTGTNLTWSLSGEPAGTSIHPTTGLMTVEDTEVGVYSLALVVMTTGGSDFENFDLTVETSNVAPILFPVDDIEITEDLLPRVYPMADYLSNPDVSTDIVWSLGGTVPAEVDIDPVSGDMTVGEDTPVAMYALTLEATNPAGADSQPFDLDVQPEVVAGYHHEFNASLGGFIHTRASSSWAVASDGILYESIVDEAAFPGCDNDGAGNWLPDVNFKGLLLEGAGVNELTAPSDFTNAAWSHLNCSGNANVASSAINGLLADELVESTANGTHRINETLSYPVDNIPYMLTFISKAGDRFVSDRFMRDQANTNTNPEYDLSNGNFDGDNIQFADLIPLGDGWYMEQCGYLDSGTGSQTAQTHFNMKQSFGGSRGYQGDGVSNILLSAAQAEFHPFPTSLMLNGTRAETNCQQSLAAMGFPAGLTNDFAFRLRHELIADREFYQGLGEIQIAEIRVDANNSIRVYYPDDSDNIAVQKVVGGAAGEAITANIGSVLRGVQINIEVDVSSTDGLILYVDGMMEAVDPSQNSSFTVPLTDFYLGSGPAGNNHFLIINELVLDPI